MGLREDMLTLAREASQGARLMATKSSEEKNSFLAAMADALDAHKDKIYAANKIDMAAGREQGLSPALLDRLELTEKRVQGMIQGIREVIALPDPVGEGLGEHGLENGLRIQKRRVPIGVIGIIYESRPNVTADAAALCLKTSNAVILRGGKEALHSNGAIYEILKKAGEAAGMPGGALQFVKTIDREAVRELVQLEDYLHLIIPRGGEGLIRAITAMSRVPVIKHSKGLCHTYVDKDADLAMALNICLNAKVQRPGVCNAMETLLIHQDVAEDFLPKVSESLRDKKVELRGDAAACSLDSSLILATDEDWDTEYLDLILSIRIVKSLEDAIDHIDRYGSNHSDAIISQDRKAQDAFINQVDSAAVYVNASTRFTDGGQFGMGAEIGISTDKLHARGPMGLKELTTYKYVVLGEGQIRE
ncbi:MAG: glutamate-5-semialdehyde dehydrogenase [Planctomycetota bacterium]|nr:glutamate-5-semialdehyde dehydrogenase [Planctomycetota bacterium]